MKICPYCKNENPDTNKFCNYCGAQLSGVEPEGGAVEEPDFSEFFEPQQASAANAAGEGSTGAAAAKTAESAGEKGAGKAAGTQAASTERTRLDADTLQKIEDYLNQADSYGFLLSAYERPEDIDLREVFYSGAGFPREELPEKEKKSYLKAASQDELHTSLTKVTEEQIEDLLARKAGITLEQSTRPLDGWLYLEKYHAYYHQHGDTNMRKVRCTDGWRQGDTILLHYQPDSYPQETEESPIATYVPTYELTLRVSGEDYMFCSNVFWVQKDLIEAQSYQAELEPMGEVFFAPFYPNTDKDPKADVSFGLVKNGQLTQTLLDVERRNIRTDRVFTGVDAVDFTDYNGDGFTDILIICSYQLVDENGSAGGAVRETRAYKGSDLGIMVVDRESAEAVNRDVETLTITNVTSYLKGRSDGKDRTWRSWKEAYAAHLEELDKEEYKGYALIYLEDGRTPAFVQVGATSGKGATVVIYRNGKLEETWLNRQTFWYLERENLLYCQSGIENLYYDTIYSVSGGRLQVAIQGYYGNRESARVQTDPDGEPVYQYFWDGGDVSKNGYTDGLQFVFDTSRARKCGEEGLLSAEEMLQKLQ